MNVRAIDALGLLEIGDQSGVGMNAIGNQSPSEEKQGFCLNEGLELFTKRSKSMQANRLQLSGLHSELYTQRMKNGHGHQRLLKRYLVRVLNLKVMEVWESGADFKSFQRLTQVEVGEANRKIYLKVAKLAIRALYIQDLDLGEVELACAPGEGYQVVRISSEPKLLQQEAATSFAKELLNLVHVYRQALAEPLHPLIGMDPEFVLYDANSCKVIPASRYLPRKGRAGCDAVWIGGRCYYPLAELRPAPAHEPSGLLRHLMGAMREAAGQIPSSSVKWQAGGMPQRGLPLGGHLHLSGVLLTPGLLRLLDSYLALPIAVLEDERARHRRPKYGYLGDFRDQPYGGFEYRTLPSFLVSPGLTKGIVALALLLVEEHTRLTSPYLKEEELASFYHGEREKLRDIVQPALREIENLRGYEKYEKEISPLLRAVRTGYVWDESRDIRKVWKIAGT